MTVHVLETPLTLPAPDLTISIARRTELKRHADTLSDFYLPVVREALSSLLHELNQVDEEALQTLNGVPALLNAKAFVRLSEALAALRQDCENDQSEAIAQVVAEADKLLLTASTGLRDQSRSLDNALVNFLAVSFGDVQGWIAPIEAEIAGIDVLIKAGDQSLAKLQEQETATSKLIDQLESVGIVDKLKPVLDLLKHLADIDPKNPAVPLIKAGIDAAAIILGLASDLLTYDHLVALRKRLQQQMDEMTTSARDLQARRRKEVEKLAQLNVLKGMETLQRDYAQEIGKLREALKRFISYAFEGDNVEQRISRFTEYAGILTTYMDDLRREWRS